jgi:mono/diheme cytochrome c family protein
MKPADLGFLALAGSLAFLLAMTAGQPRTCAMNSLDWQLFGSDTYAELEKAPEKAKSRANPLENDARAVSAGEILFQDHCAECHGEDASGARKGPSLRVSEVRAATPGTLFWILTNGVVRKKMPAWSKLPEPQRWQLVRYLKSL